MKGYDWCRTLDVWGGLSSWIFPIYKYVVTCVVAVKTGSLCKINIERIRFCNAVSMKGCMCLWTDQPAWSEHLSFQTVFYKRCYLMFR